MQKKSLPVHTFLSSLLWYLTMQIVLIVFIQLGDFWLHPQTCQLFCISSSVSFSLFRLMETLMNFNIYRVVSNKIHSFSPPVSGGWGRYPRNRYLKTWTNKIKTICISMYTKQENVFSVYALSKKLKLRTITLITLRWWCKTYLLFP